MDLPDPATIPATPEELAELHRTHREWVNKCVGGHTSWIPSLSVLLRQRGTDLKPGVTMYALNVPFNTDEQKRGMMLSIGRQLYAEQAVPAAAVFSAEAWMSPDPGPGKKPADSPERREVITVVGSSVGGKCVILSSLSITRDAENRMVPGEWSEVLTEGIRPTLLLFLWRGYFETLITKYGFPGDLK